MDIKNLFRNNKKISAKLFRNDYRKSKPTQEILGNKKVSSILNTEPERKEFNRIMREKSKSGLTARGMQETIGEMKTLSNTERYALAKEIFPNLPAGKRFAARTINGNVLKQEVTEPKKTTVLKETAIVKKPSLSKKTSEPTKSSSTKESTLPEKSSAAKKYKPGSSLQYEIAPVGFINTSNSKTTSSKSNDLPLETGSPTTAAMSGLRRKILATREEKESETPKSGFSSALAATIKNKNK